VTGFFKNASSNVQNSMYIVVGYQHTPRGGSGVGRVTV
jgi:hypothetical protein